MIYYDYSPTQLEAKANELTAKFDRERLIRPKPIDVYDVVDLIGCVPDWLYLTPDQSYFGATVFNDSYWWAWPEAHYEKGMLPRKVNVRAGTILIDRTINEGENRGIENFTVIHECFHFRLHTKCFRYRSNNYQHYCKKNDFRAESQKRKSMSAIEIIEYQANYCAAAFLMPRQAVEDAFKARIDVSGDDCLPLKLNWKIDAAITELAELFCVNYTPMKYRLQTLNVLSREETALDEYLCC